MKVKRSTLAGSWYPADPAELGQQIDGWLDESLGTSTAAMGVIVPHAGYQYSGAVAAAAYRRLRDSACGRVVIMAPSHRVSFRGVVVLEAEAFATPLGLVEVDVAVTKLADGRLVRSDAHPFLDEHSLEIQLPFVQRVLPGAKVVPLLFGDMSGGDLRDFVSILNGLADDRTAFAVSSDFTHYGWRFGYEPFPAESADWVRTRLRDLDMGAIAPVLEGDAHAFTRYLDSTGATVCGRVPVAAFLTWAGPRHRGELVAYRTSLDVTGDYRHVVSYAGITFPRLSPSAGRLG
jgi:MEMO1 family protein